MKEPTRKAIEYARRNVAIGILYNMDAEIIDLADEVEQLTFALHLARAHPDFEYATTRTARKSGEDPLATLEGTGWEPNDIIECVDCKDGAIVKMWWRNWERDDFCEENYWRRRKRCADAP